MKKFISIVLLGIIAIPIIASEKLVIYHAGSLGVPLKHIDEAFKRLYPEVRIFRESAGSRTCARKISDLGKKADIMFSADYTVIENLLIPEYSDWNISFVTNEMALMYTKNSKYASEINAQNWAEILLRSDVNYGHSDPNADPCGYRSQLVWILAEKHYKIKNLYNKLKNKKHAIRPKETDLLALLEVGAIDYLFIYRSVAMQHKEHFIILPDEINLKSNVHSNFYKQAKIQISGKKPGEFITKTGKPMVYGLTIPKSAMNRKMAIAYVDFVLSSKGRKIMQKNGQPLLTPAVGTGDISKIPASLKKYIRK